MGPKHKFYRRTITGDPRKVFPQFSTPQHIVKIARKWCLGPVRRSLSDQTPPGFYREPQRMESELFSGTFRLGQAEH